MQIRSLVPIVVVVLAGCRGGHTGSEATMVRDSVGLRIAVTGARFVETANVLASVVDTLARVGSPDDQPGSEALFRVADGLLGEDGSFVVLQGGAELRFYDPSGHLKSTVGQSGKGPGEYLLADGLRRTESGDIAVWDAQLGRLTFLSPGGAVIRTESVDMEEVAGAFPILLQIRPQSRWKLIDEARLLIFDYSFGEMPANGPSRPRVRYMTWKLDGTAVDTLGEYGGIEQTSVPRLGRVVVPTLDPEETYFAVAEDSKEVYVGDAGTDHIDRYSTSGILDLRIDLTNINRAPDSGRIAAAEERLIEQLHRRGLESVEGPVDEMVARENSPAFRGLTTDDHDRLWVRWGQQPNPSQVVYAVFDSNGVFLGRILLPPHERILAVSANRLLLLQRSSSGIETLGVYRLG